MGFGKYYGELVRFARENGVGAGVYNNVFDKLPRWPCVPLH